MRLSAPTLLRQIPYCMLLSLALTTSISVFANPVPANTGISGTPGSFINTPPDMTYFALQGDTLTSIAKRYTDKTTNWPILGKRNKIGNDRAIPIGTAILIPLELLPEEPSEAKVIAMTGNPAYKMANGTVGTLALGSILNKVESRVSSLVSNKGRFEVRTNLAVAGVRGTNFRVGVNEDGIANEVLEGGVAVNNTTAKKADELVLTAGKGNIISVSGIGKAVDLLPPPKLNDSYLLQERPTLQFQVEASPEATGYRVQIAQDKDIINVLAENRYKDKQDNRFKFDGFADGNYFVRITAIDKLGLEGLPLVKAVTLKARPEPPFTVQPKNKTRAERLDFAWTEASNAQAYHLQVAKDTEFKNLLIDKPDLKDVRFSTDRPAEGEYFWHVATIAQKEGKPDHGPYSDAQKFLVLPVTSLAPPDEGNGNQLSFSWASEPGQKFLIQISTDAEFKKLFLSKELDKAELKINRPDAGTYFIRVRSSDPDGYVSPFSS
ncbi:MAG: LysM peptidoglycan-binding domain-containing protein, partial [Burkholderiales bacterium]|nr:LysM peptidoglycan-binding domain-containing protein [Burkholderiales bacterium]